MKYGIEAEPSAVAGLALYIKRKREGLVFPEDKVIIISTGKGLEVTNKEKAVSEQKKKLLDLEKTGKYVFHGSEYEGMLEPRQAYNYKKGVKEKDDQPGIYASPMVDYAILMALINKKIVQKDFTLRLVWKKKV